MTSTSIALLIDWVHRLIGLGYVNPFVECIIKNGTLCEEGILHALNATADEGSWDSYQAFWFELSPNFLLKFGTWILWIIFEMPNYVEFILLLQRDESQDYFYESTFEMFFRKYGFWFSRSTFIDFWLTKESHQLVF